MTTQWYTGHVYHHDSAAHDALILDAVRPLLDELVTSGAADSGFFLRHWLRGPHVRVNVRTDAERWDRQVRPLITERIAAYQGAHPSGGAPDREREEAAHARLAELEREEGPTTPWEPDNTVTFGAYDQRLHVLGTVDSAELLADFHAATTPLALSVLRSKRDGASAHDTMIDLMIASAQLGCPPIVRGYLSYRSHAEGFLANCADPAGMRGRFEEIFQRNRVLLRQRLTDVLASVQSDTDTPDRPPEEDGHLREWGRQVRELLPRITELRENGHLRLPEIPVPGAAPTPEQFGRTSEFHTALFGTEDVRVELDTAAWFADYRVLLNFQYLLFNRIGISPRERFLLCHLVARSVEDAYGLPADGDLTALRQVAESRGVGPFGATTSADSANLPAPPPL